MVEAPLFQRIILGLRPGAIDRDAVEVVAELAWLLGAVLQGIFVEDRAVSGIGALLEAREFQLIGRQWRPIEAERLAEDMQLAELSARRLLDRAAQRLGVASFFEVLHDEPMSSLPSLARPGDILAVVAPRDPHERLAPYYLEPALVPGFSATTIFVPRRIGRKRGPVLALVGTPQDKGLSVAAAVARAAEERLVILGPNDSGLREGILHAAKMVGGHWAKTEFVALERLDELAFLSAAEGVQERLIVLTRPPDNAHGDMDPFVIASMRQSPIILVGPTAAADALSRPPNAGDQTSRAAVSTREQSKWADP